MGVSFSAAAQKIVRRTLSMQCAPRRPTLVSYPDTIPAEPARSGKETRVPRVLLCVLLCSVHCGSREMSARKAKKDVQKGLDQLQGIFDRAVKKHLDGELPNCIQKTMGLQHL